MRQVKSKRQRFNQQNQLHFVGGVKENALCHIIFVHGLGGKGFDTWAENTKDENTFWPQWIVDDIKDVSVWTFAYDAAKTNFIDGDSMPIFDRASHFCSALDVHGLLQKPVFFVAHSLGGLVCKKAIVNCALEAAGGLRDLRGVLFLATPHHGSGLSNIAKFVFKFVPFIKPTVLVEEMLASHSTLRELHTNYLRQAQKLGYPTYSATESKKSWGLKVVSAASAFPGDPSWKNKPSDDNHTSICKPNSKEDDHYLWMKKAIVDSMSAPHLRTNVSNPQSSTENIVGKAPQTAQSPFYLPYASLGPLFIGREQTLNQLHQALQAVDGETALGLAVQGLGGCGKTRLVVEYAYRHRKDYTAVLWLNADNIFANDAGHALDLALAALCDPSQLNLPEHQLPNQELRVVAAKRWLLNHNGWLLIADNADTDGAVAAVRQLALECRAGKILATTRITRWQGFTNLGLGKLSAAAAEQYLMAAADQRKYVQSTDANHCIAICKALDGHALALSKAAAYINERRISFSAYLSEWQSAANNTALLMWTNDPNHTDYPKSLAVTLQLSLSRLAPDAKQLIYHLSWLAPTPLPLALFNKGLDGVDDLTQARVDLEKYALLDPGRANNGDPTVSLHGVLQKVVQQAQPAAQATNCKISALAWLETEFDCDAREPSNWPGLLRLAPHALALLNDDEITFQFALAGRLAKIFNTLGILFYSRAEYAFAEPLLRRALKIGEASLGEDHLHVAASLNNLAGLLHATNRLGEAEPLMRRALKIRVNSLEEDHPNVAESLNNLAGLLHATNRLGEAEPLMRRALKIRENSLGEDHPDVANSLNNLAGLLYATNRLGEAEPLMCCALKIRENSLGVDHPDVASSLNNLAGLLRATNRLGEAEPLMRRALKIWEASLGADHPHVAQSLNNLATLLQATNRLGEAEPLMRRALKIHEASLGEEHSDVAASLNNLAALLQATNRLGEAEPLMRRALKIHEASLGEEHSDVAASLNNLAALLQATNRLGEAEPLMRRALKIHEASLGADHPHVAQSLNNLATLLQATNRLGEAEPLMRRALKIWEASLGADHPHVAQSLNNLATLLQATNRLGEAEPLMRRALKIWEASLGADHPHVAQSLNNLATLLQATNRLGEAEPLMRRAVEILVTSSSQNRHLLSNSKTVLSNFRGVLTELALPESTITERIASVLASLPETLRSQLLG